MRQLIAFLLGLSMLLLCMQGHAALPQHVSKQSEAAYNEGVVAFKNGDYSRALDAFLRARASGYTGTELTYNLGATYYRLGRYTQASREFGSLLSTPRLAALCHYNLGLIAVAEHDDATALREYRMAYEEATQPAIKHLAAEEIARLTPNTPSHSLRWLGYADIATGYDDNVALSPQNAAVLPVARTGSTLTRILAGGARQLAGTFADGVQLFGNYYGTNYQRLSQYNEHMLSLGARARHNVGSWSFQGGLSGSHITLGGTGFETLTSLQFSARKELIGGNALTAGYLYDHINGNGTYSYLSGSQNRLFVEDRITTARNQFTFGVQHEQNSRNNLATATTFISASPTRNRLYASLTLNRNERLRWNIGATYEKSRYSPSDVLVIGGVTSTVDRDDTLYIGKIGAEYGLMPHWTLRAQYRYLNNKSNVAAYSYKSDVYLASLNYLFY